MSDSASSGSARQHTVNQLISRTYDSMIAESVEEIKSILEQEPHKVFPTLRFVKGALGEETLEGEARDSDSDFFPLSYVRIWQIPKEVICILLPKLEPFIFYDSEYAADLEKGGKGTLHALFYMGLGVTPHTEWPRFGYKKSIFIAGCLELYQLRGRRLSGLIVSTDGYGNRKVDFSEPANGMYMLLPQGDDFPKTHVRHRSGHEAPLEQALLIRSAGEYEIINNHMELSAELRFGNQKFSLAGFFSELVSSDFASVRATEALNQACVRAGPAQATTTEDHEGAPAPKKRPRGAIAKK